MSPLRHPFEVRLVPSSLRRAILRWAARGRTALRGRPERLDEALMPDWQARDLGFKDGRITPARARDAP